jgi:ABC-type multidrug transport system fused ATPase/permease subunit
MIKSIKKLVEILPSEEKGKSLYLIFLLIMMAILEIIGIGSVMPFLAVISNPEIIHQNKWLAWAYNLLKFEDSHQFLFFSGLFALIVFLSKNAFESYLIWVQYRFIYRNNLKLAVKLAKAYFSMPYEFYLNTNTSNLRKNILSEVNIVVLKFLLPFLTFIAQILVAFFITTLIFMVDPLLAFIISAIMGIPYLIIYELLKRKLTIFGLNRLEANKNRYKILDQSFGGIKDVKILGKESYFHKEFSHYQKLLTDNVGKIHIFNQLPRLIVESLVIGGLLFILLYMLNSGQNIRLIIPVFGLYAVSARRLMPAIRGLIVSLNTLRANQPALDVLYRDFKNKERYVKTFAFSNKISDKLPFKKEIKLCNMSYSYDNRGDKVINNINLKIGCKSSIAFVGPSGGGKTTLADLIMGLLEPQEGFIQVDGNELSKENIRNWCNNIGYVPQQIFLNDDTVTRNIAYGIADDEINATAVESAARLAFLHDFVMQELADGFDTIIGEKGVRLSGGQRQRIGLARALYHNPEVLILDEATSSLDGITEANINKALNKLSGKKTLIVIAHRITTVKKCDIIYFIEKGQIVAHGKYQNLLEENSKFRAMAQ